MLVIDAERLEQARQLVNALQEWINAHDPEDKFGLRANLLYTPYALEIAIDDHSLWGSEYSGDEEMTLPFCKAAFLERALTYLPFLVRGGKAWKTPP